MGIGQAEAEAAPQLATEKLGLNGACGIRYKSGLQGERGVGSGSDVPGFNPDLVQVRSVRNANMLLEQPFYSSEMLNFSTSSNPNFFEPSSSTSSRVMMSPQLPLVFPHSLDIHSSPELRNSGCDWMLNNDASTHSASAETNPNSIFIPDELAGLQSGPGEMHHNSLQDIMTSPMQQGHGIWVENQLVFLPNNVNQLPQNSLRCKKTSDQFLVMRRYKQHHQQMQMVVSSFESVAGLSSATPYVSKALKSVSRHFKCLESAISDQLKRIRQVLAEELSGGSSKMESNMGRVRLMEQSFERNKFIMGSSSSTATAAGFNFEQQQQQQAWRPQQKGLPERAVAILRAWYPTDADKHMLAARTGLSRNQRIYNNTIQVQCSEIGSVETNVEEVEAQHWNQEKRSKVEYCEVASSMEEEEETATGFVPYRRSEVGGVGSVSLTLGLRHGVELGAQSHHHQLRRHFAGQIINHFNLLPN
ncbi:BEL1-like homeodomain protein 8 [Senna tora]|uniref:BEL1-like homeodomain protein 8 n=1 Tax=Senna tora TaxID=362788 RepID=A0A834SKY3_9FABA|nr:BEL1-like homeodomain protein 8 [Senna tora]